MLSRLFLRPSNLRLVTLVSSKSHSKIFSSFIRPLSTNSSSGAGNGNGNGGNRSDAPWAFSGVNDDKSDPFYLGDSWPSSGVAGSGKWPDEPKPWNMKEEEDKVVFDTGGEVAQGIETGRDRRASDWGETEGWNMKEGEERAVLSTGIEVANGFGTSGEMKSNEWDGPKPWNLKDEEQKVVFDTRGEMPFCFETSLENAEEERVKELIEKEEKELSEIINYQGFGLEDHSSCKVV